MRRTADWGWRLDCDNGWVSLASFDRASGVHAYQGELRRLRRRSTVRSFFGMALGSRRARGSQQQRDGDDNHEEGSAAGEGDLLLDEVQPLMSRLGWDSDEYGD